MDDNKKREFGLRLRQIIDDMKALSQEYHVGISVMAMYDVTNDNVHACQFLHYDEGQDRMVDLLDREIEDAFFIERDDTVRKEDEHGENDTAQ